MAKYNVTHTCGHEVVHDIVGTNSHGERDNKIEWLSTTLCQCCYAKSKAGDVEELEMHYSEYKNNYADCKTKPNSYNAKTIVVYVSKQ